MPSGLPQEGHLMAEGESVQIVNRDEMALLRSYRRIKGTQPDMEMLYLLVPVAPELMARVDREDLIAKVTTAAIHGLTNALADAVPVECVRGSNAAQGIDHHWCSTHGAEWLLSEPRCARATGVALDDALATGEV